MYSIVMIFVLAVVVAILRIIARGGGVRKVNGFGLQRAVFLYRHF